MISNINQKVQQVLNSRKKSAEQTALQNLLLARKNKEFLCLEKQECALVVDIAKKEFLGENASELRKTLEETQKNKENLLKKLNLNIKPVYFCKKCLDCGTYENKICDCKKEILNELLKKEAGNFNESYTFENAKLDDTEKLLFDKMQAWCEKYPNVKSNTIFICGGIGVGKSYLSYAMANKLIEKKHFVYFTTAFALNNMFLDYCKNSNKDALDVLLGAEVLFIDDLGTEPILKNITLNYLYLILNERMLAKKVTIINSNLLPDEILERYEERIFSRIMNKQSGLILGYKGNDRRIKK